MLASESTREATAVRWVAKDALPGLVRRGVMRVDVVMDIGCGIEPQTLVWPTTHLCVEVHDEYVEYLRERLSGSPRYVVMHSPWQDALRIMSSRSVDTVFALDFIEHLPKKEGLAFIREAERVARRQVVIYTPLGYFPQSYEDAGAEDRWGLHGGHWQTHRSGWTPEDFSEEWEIIACRDYHTEDQHGPLTEPIGCIWAIRTLPRALADDSGEMESRLWRKATINRYVPSWCRPALRRAKRLLLPVQP